MNETLKSLVETEGYEGIIRALAALAAKDAEECPGLVKVYGKLTEAAIAARKAEAA